MENTTPKLFMLMLGCKPKGRHTEQHDIFFGIGHTPKDLIPQLLRFWPEAKGKLHVDAWRQVNQVDGFAISIVPKTAEVNTKKLFFINLGGYTHDVFDEQHYKLLAVATDKASATAQAKQTLFYQQITFPGANSHIDDQYGIDVDDLYAVEDILSWEQKEKYRIKIAQADNLTADKINLGYFKLDKLP
jgi:hypothetical protein